MACAQHYRSREPAALQLEALEEVERAFVHVDYSKRDEPEHKVERNLLQGKKDLQTPHASVADSSGRCNMPLLRHAEMSAAVRRSPFHLP